MENRENFTRIDAAAYFNPARAIDIQKIAKISAVPAVGGEHIMTVMANGLVETEKTAKAGDYIITNPGGEQYIIGGAKFAARYQPAGPENTYMPVDNPLKAMRLTQDVKFESPWGGDMHIAHGGVLVNNGGTDVYGIQPQEFHDTYTLLIMRGVKEGMARVGIRNVAAGVGVGMNAYSIYSKISDPHSTFRTNLANPERAGLAKASMTMDVTALTLSATSLALNINQSWNAALLQGVSNSPYLVAGSRYLGYAGIAIRVGSAAIDFEAARRDENVPKMKQVFGETAGGLSGGIALGIAGAKLGALVGGTIGSAVPVLGTATGAAAGATIFSIGGAIAGSMGGGEIGKYILNHTGDGWLKSMFTAKAAPPSVTAPVAAPVAVRADNPDQYQFKDKVVFGAPKPTFNDVISAQIAALTSPLPILPASAYQCLRSGPELVLH